MYVAPGLPGITGRTTAAATGFWSSTSNPEYTGLFFKAGTKGGYLSGATGSGDILGVDASLSNAIYGASGTVQPPAVNFCPAIYLGKLA